jgi:hypothetical protein
MPVNQCPIQKVSYKSFPIVAFTLGDPTQPRSGDLFVA